MSEVRHLIPADLDAYRSLRLASLEECPEAFATDADAWRGASVEIVERHLVASEQDPGARIFGAWEGEVLSGILGLKRDTRPSIAHKAGLWGFYVAADRRRRGRGRALLLAALEAANGVPGLRQVRAGVPAGSTDAIALMENVGFRRFGVEPDAKLVDGSFHDQVYLWYRLTDDGQGMRA